MIILADFKLITPCRLGVEGLVSNDLKNMGMENVISENGRILFDGDERAIARANINLRYSERVQILLGDFVATDFDMLFDGVKALPWENFIGRDDCFPVKGSCVSSQLASVPNCQSIIKKAIVERLKSKYNITWFSEEGATYQVQFLIMKDKVSLMIDTSGAGLHKRGYRKKATDAPIKETLAAAMANIARVRSDGTFYDPFCGSGTVLIEAAMYALNVAPGIKRNFSAQNFNWINKSLWDEERVRAKDLIKRNTTFTATGFDIDQNAVNLSLENAKKAGIAKCIDASVRDIRDFKSISEYGCVICNPPYGERLLDVNTARAIYKTMGQVFESKRGWSYSVITPDEDFEKCFGKKADKRRKLYNGMLKCQLFQYFK